MYIALSKFSNKTYVVDTHYKRLARIEEKKISILINNYHTGLTISADDILKYILFLFSQIIGSQISWNHHYHIYIEIEQVNNAL